MIFDPPKGTHIEILKKLQKQLVETVHHSFKSLRILTKKSQNFENLLGGKITEEGSPDLMSIITNSVAY
jgi:hypothetical protein